MSGVGVASGETGVTSLLQLTSISPSGGSIYGGTTLTIAGTGFASNNSLVSIDGAECDIISATGSEIQCTTPAHAAGVADVTVSVGNIVSNAESYTYDDSRTPTITDVRYESHS